MQKHRGTKMTISFFLKTYLPSDFIMLWFWEIPSDPEQQKQQKQGRQPGKQQQAQYGASGAISAADSAVPKGGKCVELEEGEAADASAPATMPERLITCDTPGAGVGAGTRVIFGLAPFLSDRARAFFRATREEALEARARLWPRQQGGVDEVYILREER